MKLAEWAKKNGVSYITAFRWFKAGELPVKKTIQMSNGTILVFEDEESSHHMEKEKWAVPISKTYKEIISKLPKNIEQQIENNSAIKNSFIKFCENFAVEDSREKILPKIIDTSKEDKEFEEIKNDAELYDLYLKLVKAQPKVLTPEEFKDLKKKTEAEKAITSKFQTSEDIEKRLRENNIVTMQQITDSQVQTMMERNNGVQEAKGMAKEFLNEVIKEFDTNIEEINKTFAEKNKTVPKTESRLDKIEKSIETILEKLEVISKKKYHGPTAEEQITKIVEDSALLTAPTNPEIIVSTTKSKIKTAKLHEGIRATDVHGRPKGFSRAK